MTNKTTTLEKVFHELSKISLVDLFFYVFSQTDVQDFIVELNTKDQLFNRGVDSEGVELSQIGGPYSASYRQLKGFLGLPTDRVTLFLTGETHKSFDFKITGPGIGEISADLIVGEENFDLEIRWGENIIGLDEQSHNKLSDYIGIYGPLFLKERLRDLL